MTQGAKVGKPIKPQLTTAEDLKLAKEEVKELSEILAALDAKLIKALKDNQDLAIKNDKLKGDFIAITKSFCMIK